ncbi:MAG: hypothetical protein RXP27_03405 [Nitrososphaeria archaeon]
MRSYGSRVYAHPEEIPVIEGRRRMYSRSKLISIIGAIARPRPVKGSLTSTGFRCRE